jgi:hypothetical protein
MVDFKQQGFQIVVYYNIKTEDLKAHQPLHVSRLTRMIIVREVLLYGQ